MSRALGWRPELLNSFDLSWVRRPRPFWVSTEPMALPGVELKDRGFGVVLRSRVDKVVYTMTLGRQLHAVRTPKPHCRIERGALSFLGCYLLGLAPMKP